MQLNISFNDFKKKHSKKTDQILFKSLNCRNYHRVENLYKFLLAEKNSFIFESVEKGINRGRYTIIGLNPDKIWDIKDNTVTLSINKKKTKIKTNPLKYLNKLIKEFKIKIPKQLPSMGSMLVGYFSYDIIRYIEKIPNKCKDDLKIPDVRLCRPKNLIIYDNLKKKIHYIENVYADVKIKNYKETYDSILKRFELYKSFENIKLPDQFTFKPNKNLIKSNTSKNKFKSLIKKAKSSIKILLKKSTIIPLHKIPTNRVKQMVLKFSCNFLLSFDDILIFLSILSKFYKKYLINQHKFYHHN